MKLIRVKCQHLIIIALNTIIIKISKHVYLICNHFFFAHRSNHNTPLHRLVTQLKVSIGGTLDKTLSYMASARTLSARRPLPCRGLTGTTRLCRVTN